MLQISPLTETVRHVIDVIFNKVTLSKSKINWKKRSCETCNHFITNLTKFLLFFISDIFYNNLVKLSGGRVIED